MQLTLVGNPGSRRVEMFSAAVRDAGLPGPSLLPWHDVLLGAPAPGPGELVRIDSPGEDAEVDRLLRGASWPARYGEVVGLPQAYAGLLNALAHVASGGARLLNDPAEIAVLCDKRLCHRVLSAAGVPVPPALPPVHDWASLRAAMTTAGWSRVFVKPAHGSSASGVIALAVNGPRLRAVTSAELTADGIFNSLRVRTYDREADAAAIVDGLGGALHVERWLPKAQLDGKVIDVRVVVVAGRPTHAVVRASRTPMTNLHLGNSRGDLAALKREAGRENWAAAMATCVRAAACCPRSLQVGVDLMFQTGWRRHAVAEVNAFGDLLPGVLAGGRDTYAEQVHALVTGRADLLCAS